MVTKDVLGGVVMKKVLENIIIGFGLVGLFIFMLTGTYVFAKDPTVMEEKSYYVEAEKDKDYFEKDLVLSNKVTKKVETAQNSIEYELQIINGNVILINLNNGSKSSVYSKGDAKFLTTVDYYYYDSAYVLIITEDGSLYTNIYSNNDYHVKFKKIKTVNDVRSLKVLEKKQRFYEYPSVELFGVNSEGSWEKIKM